MVGLTARALCSLPADLWQHHSHPFVLSMRHGLCLDHLCVVNLHLTDVFPPIPTLRQGDADPHVDVSVAELYCTVECDTKAAWSVRELKRERKRTKKTTSSHRCRILVLVLQHDNLKAIDFVQLLDGIVHLGKVRKDQPIKE